MRNNKTTLVKKLLAVEEAELTGNVRKTARKFKVQPSQIRRWRRDLQKIKEKNDESPKKLTVNSGRKVQNEDLEKNLYDWVVEQRRAELSVSTCDIIDNAVSLEPEFCNNHQKKLKYWVYRFMKRYRLAVRCKTRVSQITSCLLYTSDAADD